MEHLYQMYIFHPAWMCGAAPEAADQTVHAASHNSSYTPGDIRFPDRYKCRFVRRTAS